MSLWFTEKQTPNFSISFKVNKTLHTEKTPYQDLALYDTEEYGKLLTLDNCVMTTIKDEFVYHEMITHIPLFTHNNPKKVLVIGGGDGGAIREIVKHDSIEKAVLVDIDKAVIDVSKKYLPEISCALDHPKVEVLSLDGLKYVNEMKNYYDIIMVDSTDPVGPAEGLFEYDFYKDIYEALKEDGIFVAQTESPFYHDELIKNVNKDVKALYPVVKLYLAHIPTYPGGMWSFTMGSKKYDPSKTTVRDYNFKTRYFTKEIYKAAFVLPKFVKDIIL